MQMRILFTLLPLPFLANCVGTPGAHSQERENARIGEAVYVDGPVIRPIAVLEDSRCPATVQCVWAGRVRIKAIWLRGDKPKEIILSSDKPTPIADGMMGLTNIRPARPKNGKIGDGKYRFTLNFVGGF
jgi:hypothetical protein